MDYRCPPVGLWSHYIAIYFHPALLSQKSRFLDPENLTEEDMANLTEECYKMKLDFAILVAQTGLSLKRRSATVNSLISVLGDASQVTKKLKNETGLSNALSIISDFWSFFDFEILGAVINGICGDEADLREALKTYMSDFEHFCERKICEVPDFFNAEVKQKGHTYLYVKLDESFTILLKKIKRITAWLSKKLNTSMRLLKIKDDSVELIYTSLSEEISFSEQKEDQEELLQMGISEIFSKILYYEREEGMETTIAPGISTTEQSEYVY